MVHRAPIDHDWPSGGNRSGAGEERRQASLSKTRPSSGMGDRHKRPRKWWTTTSARWSGGARRLVLGNPDIQHLGTGNLSKAAGQRGRLAAISRPGLCGKSVHCPGRVATMSNYRLKGSTKRPGSGPSGSNPWSNSRLDLVQVLAPVVGPHWVERAGLIQAREHLIWQRRHELVGLLCNFHRQFGDSAWRNRVDQRTRRVVDPVHILGLVFGRRERLAAQQLAGEVERTAVPERDVAEHAGHAPVLVDHGTKLAVAQTRRHRPHPRELARV